MTIPTTRHQRRQNYCLRHAYVGRALALLVAILFVVGPTQPVTAQADRRAATPSDPTAEIEPGWQAAAQEQIRQSEYQLSWQESNQVPGLGAAFQAPNRAHNLRAFFTPEGITVIPRTCDADDCAKLAWQWGLSPASYGRADQLKVLSAGSQPQVEGNHATYNYPGKGIQMWYVNNERGLEQGFTLGARPGGDGPLRLSLRYSGDLQPALHAGGQAIEWITPGGVQVLRYDSLVAYDADGHTLPARMEVEAGSATIRLVVEDTDAIYPLTIDPLTSSPAWTAESDQDGAHFGLSVSAAGDVNGDGYSDVIVGAREYDNGQTDEGRAFVYHGSATGLNTTANWIAESDQVGALFGESVSAAGDVNGDGYSDIIVAAAHYDNGQIDEGRAFVYHGSDDGLSTTANWTAESDQELAYFGTPVGAAGDVNGDGYDDVIVGAPAYDNGQTNEGRAYVYHGSAAGLAAAPTWTAESDQDYAEFGVSVSAAGDVNGDGYGDVIVGARWYDNGQADEGRALVYHGSAAGLSATANWTAESNQANAGFGFSASAAGDVNGDGFGDVIVGAYNYDNGQTDEGRAFVYYGSAAGLSATANWTAESDQADALFGLAVSSAGDVNQDGYSDIIVGAPNYDNGQVDEGWAFVYRGSEFGLSTWAFWTAESDQDLASFGARVSAAGDVNGDGYDDIIIGAPGYDNGQTDEGRSFVYHGSATDLSATPAWAVESDQADAHFGKVSDAGDVNGDGYGDVIIGAELYDNGEADEGRAFVYHGSAAGLSATANWTAESDQANAWFGYSVSAAGDINGDGYDDIIVGAALYDNGEGEGRAFVYYGSAAGLNATANWTAEGDQSYARFGWSVSEAGDVNGDGYGDVIVGAYLYDNGQTDEGRAFVYYGSAAGLSATANWTAESDQADAWFGLAVSSAGDVNGDGYDDIIVGAVFYDNGQTDEGRAFVYHGSAAGLSMTPNWTAESDQNDAWFGQVVSSAGDVNGDGYDDIMVGAFNYDNGQTDEGRAFVYHGSAAGLSMTPNWTAESDQADAHFSSVSTAGDVNGDGYGDVIVGAYLYDNGQTDEGRALVYHGSTGGLGVSPAWTAESGQDNAGFGLVVSDAGDVNGDGYGDVIVGAWQYDNGQTDEGRAFVYIAPVAPGVFSKSAPTSGATNQPTTLTLSWAASSNATNYEYCFDTSNDSVCAGSWVSTGMNTSAIISGLSPAATYNWQVRANSPGGTTYANSGVWWSFTIVTPPPTIYVSSNSNGVVGGISFADEDVLAYDLATKLWYMVFDGSDVGLSAADVDAFSLQPDGSLLLSLDVPLLVGSLGMVDDSDILRFRPNSLGMATVGTFELFWDGSAYGLTSDSEDVDALAFAPDGRLLVSTVGQLTVTGSTLQDEDLAALDLSTGIWDFYFDGSDVGLAELGSEDVYGAALNQTTGDIYLTTLGAFDVPGGTGGGADILLCMPGAVGKNTACTYSLIWDGSAHGFGGEVMDALEVVTTSPMLWGSTQTQLIVGGQTFNDEDIFALDIKLGVYTTVFDGSDVGLTGDVDAFSRLADGSLLLSLDAAVDIAGLGTVDDSDILRFIPTALGLTTAGTFELYFDGSAYGLTEDGEDIDALALAPDGRLLVSTMGNLAVNGLTALDEDLSALNLSTGVWSLYFDGSDVGLMELTTEDVNGAWVNADASQVYLTTVGAFDVPGVTGDGSDILLCQVGSLGDATSCTYSLYLDGSTYGMTSVLDGLELIMP